MTLDIFLSIACFILHSLVNISMISDFDLDVIVPIRKQKRNVNSIYRINYFKNCFHISLILTLNKKCFTTELNIREERVVFVYFYLCTYIYTLGFKEFNQALYFFLLLCLSSLFHGINVDLINLVCTKQWI